MVLELEWKKDVSNFRNLDLTYNDDTLFTAALISKFKCGVWRSLDGIL